MDVPAGMEISEVEAIQLAMLRGVFPEWELQWAWNENGEKEIMRVVGCEIATGEDYRPQEDDTEEVWPMARENAEYNGIEVIEELRRFAASHDLFFKTCINAKGYTDAYVYSHDMQSDSISPDTTTYRYAFARCWAHQGPLVLWVMANPGTGDTDNGIRPTLNRCINWSKKWKFSGLMIGNLFAARSKKTELISKLDEPVGRFNDVALKLMTRLAKRTVVAWGNWGAMKGRAAEVLPLLSNLTCLKITGEGHPWHPLYAKPSEDVASGIILLPYPPISFPSS